MSARSSEVVRLRPCARNLGIRTIGAREVIVAHVRCYVRRQAALCHLPSPTPHLSNKIRPFRLFSGDGDRRPLRVRGTCFRSSVLFRGRLFAFVLQTSRHRFAWRHPSCIIFSLAVFFHKHTICTGLFHYRPFFVSDWPLTAHTNLVSNHDLQRPHNHLH